MNMRFHTVSHAQSQVSSNSNRKFRTIMKIRNVSFSRNSSECSITSLKNKEQPTSTLPALTSSKYETLSQNDRNNANVKEAENCEEDLILKKEDKYEKVKQKLESLNLRVEDLIQRKIIKLRKKQHNLTLKNRGKDQLSQGLEQIIREIKTLKIQALEDCGYGKEEFKYLMNEKINLLEKLMAEKNAQSEILKRYFFAINSINQKKKFKTEQNHFRSNVSQSRKAADPFVPKKSVLSNSCARNDFKAPKMSEYETFRHKNKQYNANNQPIPRSSYNRQFLTYNYKHTTEMCRQSDSPAFFTSSRKPEKSTYTNYFHGVQTDKVNYKQLDSYRNKIKNIQLSYSYCKNQLSPEQLQRNKKQAKRKFLEKQMSTDLKKIIEKHEENKTHHPILFTESRRQYAGIKGNKRTIKNKGLDKLKFVYKSLAYS